MAVSLEAPPISNSATSSVLSQSGLSGISTAFVRPEAFNSASRRDGRKRPGVGVRQLLKKAVEKHQHGELREALKLYRQVLQRDPNSADAWHLAGVIAVAFKMPEDAAEQVERALKLCPNQADYHATMAQIQTELRQWNKADTHARNALALDAGCPAALHAMGLVLCHRGDIRSACRHFRDAVVGEPTIGRVWLDYGDCLNQVELYEESLEALQKALELMPASPLPLNSLGSFWHHQGDTELALQYFTEALRLDDTLAVTHHNIANLYLANGRARDAIPHFRRLLQLDDFTFIPTALHALSKLARTGDYEFSDDELDQIEDLCLTPDIPDHELSLLHFARARVFEFEELFDDAFEDYSLANHYRLNVARSRGATYRPDNVASQVDVLVETFTPDFFAQARSAGIGNPTEAPVFLVGFPRSGSHLVEAVLASHPQIVSNGRLSDIERIAWRTLDAEQRTSVPVEERFPHWLRGLDAELLEIAGNAYLEHVTGIAPDAARIIDAMPQSYHFAGFIALLFPNARIIHCRRAAIDTCLSNFTFTATEPQTACVSSSMSNLAWDFEQYVRLMKHWKSVLPDSLIEVQYEDLATDPQTQYSRLLDLLGMPADETARDFGWVHANSVGRWRRFAGSLRNLAARDDAIRK